MNQFFRLYTINLFSSNSYNVKFSLDRKIMVGRTPCSIGLEIMDESPEFECNIKVLTSLIEINEDKNPKTSEGPCVVCISRDNPDVT